jgi:osmotically inducible protein OsmC
MDWSLKEGSGKISTQSTVLNNTQYSFKSRFEEGVGTNPEELIAAALRLFYDAIICLHC